MILSIVHAVGCFLERNFARSVGCVKGFFADNRGVSTVEYALIVVAVVAIVGGAGVVLSDAFDDLFVTLEENLTNETDTLGALNPDGADAGADTTG